MEPADARAYIQRWEAVAEIEQQEQKQASVAENWRRLNAIRRRAARLGITRKHDDGEMEVLLMWANLRAQYAAI